MAVCSGSATSLTSSAEACKGSAIVCCSTTAELSATAICAAEATRLKREERSAERSRITALRKVVTG